MSFVKVQQGSKSMRNKMVGVAATVVMLIAAAVTVSAHHSFSAEFDGSKTVTLEGKVHKMDFVNPHSWLYIDATMPDGKVERWGIEGGSPNVMFRLGWSRDTLLPGTRIRAIGSPAKDGAKRMNGRIELLDGKKLDLGGTKQ
jgi:Family of unknown function (DUF6152)